MRAINSGGFVVAILLSFSLAASHTTTSYGPFDNSPYPPINNTFFHEAVMDQADIDYWPQVQNLEYILRYERNGVSFPTANEQHYLPIRGGVWDIQLYFTSGSPVAPSTAGFWTGASFLTINWLWCDTGQYPIQCYYQPSCNYGFEPCYDSAAGTIS